MAYRLGVSDVLLAQVDTMTVLESGTPHLENSFTTGRCLRVLVFPPKDVIQGNPNPLGRVQQQRV